MSATTQPVYTRRGLILHDVLAFLALLSVSVVLFVITLFLFRSFQQHRVSLAQRWSARGRLALANGKPDEAVDALRTALSYTPEGPDARDEQRLLAQSLAAAGHTDEAANYYSSLWESHPGDGFVNLQLARLSRQRNENAAATDYYRAAVYGSWEGDAVPRRREVRLELADFLILEKRNEEARNELFVVAGNSPGDAHVNALVADKLEQAGYAPDALHFYNKASQLAPDDPVLLAHAGQAAYRLGDYAGSATLLGRALALKAAPGDSTDRARLAALQTTAERIQQLSLGDTVPAGERTVHLQTDAKLAQTRLHTCIAASGGDAALTEILARWTPLQSDGRTGPRKTKRLPSQVQASPEALTPLIYQTEQVTATSCGAPAGDDALLLELANAAQPPVAQRPQQALPPLAPSVSSLNKLFGRRETVTRGK